MSISFLSFEEQARTTYAYGYANNYEEEYPEIGSGKEATAIKAASSTCSEPSPPAAPVFQPSAPPKKITPAPDMSRRKRRRLKRF